jgi:hypothetical protein
MPAKAEVVADALGGAVNLPNGNPTFPVFGISILANLDSIRPIESTSRVN